MKKILAYRFSAIGDVTLLLPILKGALNTNPDIEIYFVSRPFFAPIFNNIARLHFVGVDIKKEYNGLGGLFRLQQKLMQEINPDIILDFHQVLRTQILNCFFKTLHFKKVYCINKGRTEKKTIVKTKQFKTIPSTVDRYAEVVTKAGLFIELPEAPLIKVEDPTELFQKLSTGDDLKQFRLIGVAPFSAHQQKEWGLANFAKLIEMFEEVGGIKTLLFGGGKHEIQQLEQLASSFKHCIVVGHKLNFNEEIKLLPHLSLMISMDSANMHFGSVAGVPVISIWGATHPALGFKPYKQDEKNIIQYSGNEINCRPCSVYGNKACLYHNDIKCMNLVKPEEVLKRTLEILGK